MVIGDDPALFGEGHCVHCSYLNGDHSIFDRQAEILLESAEIARVVF